MDCEKVKSLMLGYIRHTASPEDSGKVEEHLCVCNSCREVLAKLMDTMITIPLSKEEKERQDENDYSAPPETQTPAPKQEPATEPELPEEEPVTEPPPPKEEPVLDPEIPQAEIAQQPPPLIPRETPQPQPKEPEPPAEAKFSDSNPIMEEPVEAKPALEEEAIEENLPQIKKAARRPPAKKVDALQYLVLAVGIIIFAFLTYLLIKS